MPEASFYVGIDVGNERHALCVVDEHGKLVRELFVPNDARALTALQEATKGAPPSVVFVAVEDKNSALVDALVDDEYAVFTINPKQVDRFRDRVSVAGAKDDRRDARVLATTLLTDHGLYRRVAVDDDAVIVLRVIESQHDGLQDEERRLANQLRAVVLRCYPSMLTLCEGADEPWFWGALKRLGTGEAMTEASLTAMLKACRKRKVKAVDIQAALVKEMPARRATLEATHGAMALLVERLELVRAHRQRIVKRRAELLARMRGTAEAPSDVDIALSMPGIGKQTVAVLATTVLPLLKDKNGLAMVRAQAGVAPVTMRSGKSTIVVMRRACNARLRQALHHAAAAATLHDDALHQRMARLRSKGRSRGSALRAVADHMLLVLAAMLRTRTLYRSTVIAAAA